MPSACAPLTARFNADDQAGDGLATGLPRPRRASGPPRAPGPRDMDVVSVYDDYPAMVLVQLADLGFAPDGDVRRLVAERIATRALPVNTSGGQLCCGQAGAAGGMHGLVEVVRQLRGEAGQRQVDEARLAVVAGYGMVAYRYGAARERRRPGAGLVNGLAVCTTCGRAAFPAPDWCPACGGADWREEELGAGAVEETTFVRRAPGGAWTRRYVSAPCGWTSGRRSSPGSPPVRRAGRASGSSSRRGAGRAASEAAPAPTLSTRRA